jgi:mycoredoxin
MDLIVYSASWCGACKGLKTQLEAAGLTYEERSLDDDDILLEAQRLGIKSLPAVRIPGTDAALSTSSAEFVKDFMDNVGGGETFVR